MEEKSFPYIPNTVDDTERMLREIGCGSLEDLLKSIPAEFRLSRSLELPGALSEPDLVNEMLGFSRKNASNEAYSYFLGAGAYHHYIPSIVSQLIGRSEFYTSYTPYQAEISQGNLQAVYEFQSLICALTDMEVANASMYDGASALAEAVLMAERITGKRRVLVPAAIHPEYKQVVATYTGNMGMEIIEYPFSKLGTSDIGKFEQLISDSYSCVVIQNPNFLGCIEDMAPLVDLAHKNGALAVGLVVEPISLGILNPPGALEADIVVGEAQGLGNPLSYGGPYVGFFATKEEFVREMPGRLVGMTQDRQGRRGYCLTLATREQHIRRGKATSNICTNEALCALASTIYLVALGRRGFQYLSKLNFQRAEYLKARLRELPGYSLKYPGPTFNEFVLTLPGDVAGLSQYLWENDIIGGLELRKFFPHMEHEMLMCVTEMNNRHDIDRLLEVLSSYE